MCPAALLQGVAAHAPITAKGGGGDVFPVQIQLNVAQTSSCTGVTGDITHATSYALLIAPCRYYMLSHAL